MRILLTLLASIFAAGPLASAQVWTPTSGISTNWQFIAASADGTKLVALNSLYGIYSSTNSGSNWQKATNGPVLTYANWSSLAGSADGSKWVATAYYSTAAPGNGGIFISTNSGMGWTQTGTMLELEAVACSADGSKMTALGYWVYYSTNSGLSWIQSSMSNNSWSSVAMSADGTKLAAATADGHGVYISTNSGGNWTPYSAPNRNWFSLVSSADGSKLAAVDYGNGVYTSTNSGTTWITNEVPAAVWSGIAASADGTRLVAVATNGLIYTSTNSGAFWASNSVPTNHWSAVASSADGFKLAAAINGGGIYTSYTPPNPQLSLVASNRSVAFSWTVASTNFVIQQITNLAKLNWVKLTNKPVLNLTSLQDQVTMPLSNGIHFYRLTTP